MRKQIADWTNPEDYPNPDNTSPQRWAFEFLRRNKEYQKDFFDYLGVCESIVPGFNPFTYSGNEGEEKAVALEDDERHWVFDPPRLEGESESAWLNRVGHGRRTPLPVWYGDKWGLGYLFNPFADYNVFQVSFIDAVAVTSAWPETPNPTTHHSQAFLIDYRKPLANQIEAIKEYAVSHQSWLVREGHIPPVESHWKRRGAKLRLQLRCLDAVDSGVSQTKIASVLSNEDAEGFDISRIGKGTSD